MPTKISVNLRGCLYKCRDGTKMHDKVIFFRFCMKIFPAVTKKLGKTGSEKVDSVLYVLVLLFIIIYFSSYSSSFIIVIVVL